MTLVGAVLVIAVLLFRWQRSGQKFGDYLGIGLVYLYARLWHGWRGAEAPLPAKGAAILIANHSCSADPAFLTAGCSRPLSFLIAREYYNIPLLRRLLRYMGCVPVNRNGRDASALRAGLRRLAEGRVLCIFPEGGLSHAGLPRLGRGKPGVALLALRSRAPVFPALIRGGPRTSDLPRAWLRPSRVRVTFGRALDLSPYYDRPINRRLLEEVTAFLMGRIAALEKERSRP